MPTFDNAKVFKIAETVVDNDEVDALMKHFDKTVVGGTAEEWFINQDTPDDAAFLIEVAGRMCYKSFGTGLNENITRTREGNSEYMDNILRTKHGSVLEHASVSFALCGVSRVFTHELVRHRAGTAYSQESMRFVRVESIRFYYPEAFNTGVPEIDDEVERVTDDALRNMEETYKKLANLLLSDDMPFSEKKKITSAMRRLLPDGILTDIVITANHRTWRHLIEIRTAEAAEEEIIWVFGKIARRLQADHPTIYQDMHRKAGTDSYVFDNSKV